MGKVKIYSNRHKGWWKQDFEGYTTDESEAGVYDMDKINSLYPDITFNDDMEDYFVGYDLRTILAECVALLNVDGSNTKKVVQHKLLDLLTSMEE